MAIHCCWGSVTDADALRLFVRLCCGCLCSFSRIAVTVLAGGLEIGTYSGLRKLSYYYVYVVCESASDSADSASNSQLSWR